jgi:sigma-B regulation protein RsbU (phosphoserine phosphatase)
LEIAHEIQANILPREYPKTSNFEFAGAYRSAREVGGDYYDFIDIDKDHLGFLIADVSGKSLPGMLVMLLTRDIIVRLAGSIKQPADLLKEVNRELLLSIKRNMFVTMFYGVLNKTTGCFIFASAGHNPLVRLNGQTGESELIKTKGYPLGMIPPEPFDKRIETGRILLLKNDWLIQYTDGINEAQNSDGEEFGMDRFVQVLQSHRLLCPKELSLQTLGRLERFVDSAPQYDDITLVTMKWVGSRVDNILNEPMKELHAS